MEPINFGSTIRCSAEAITARRSRDETPIRPVEVSGTRRTGGRIVRDAVAPAWWALADSAGNEADIATTMGRD